MPSLGKFCGLRRCVKAYSNMKPSMGNPQSRGSIAANQASLKGPGFRVSALFNRHGGAH